MKPKTVLMAQAPFLMMASVAAFSGLNSERNSIEVPRIGTDVNVTCGGKEISIEISPHYIQRNSAWLGDGSFLSLSDLDCRGEKMENGGTKIRVMDDFTKCDMLVEEVQDINENGEFYVTDYKFTNHLVHDASHGSVIAREIDLVELTCSYASTQITSDYMQPWIKTSAIKSKVKNLHGDMRLFKNENYTDFYTEPPVLSLEDVLYVEVNMERPLVSDIDSSSNSNIVVVMEKCWGTPVADRDNTLRYYMINDGCPVTGDSSMHIRGNGNSLQGRFDIKMFKFIGDDLNDVWLHCTVRACNATEADSCVPDCSEDARRKRRNAEDGEDFVPAAGKQLNYVSLDYTMIADLPIQRKREHQREEILERVIITQGSVTILTPGTISFTVMLCVVSLVVLLAIVFGITCMLVRRRRQTMKALTESQFSFK